MSLNNLLDAAGKKPPKWGLPTFLVFVAFTVYGWILAAIKIVDWIIGLFN